MGTVDNTCYFYRWGQTYSTARKAGYCELGSFIQATFRTEFLSDGTRYKLSCWWNFRMAGLARWALRRLAYKPGSLIYSYRQDAIEAINQIRNYSS